MNSRIGFAHKRRLAFIVLYKTVSLASLLMLIPMSGIAQNCQEEDTMPTNKLSSFISYVEKLYGTDDKLFNGYQYFPPDERIQSHPYFKSYNWALAELFINGTHYVNKKIKYNIEQDIIVLKYDVNDSAFRILQINSSRIDSVRLNNHLLVNVANYTCQNSKMHTYAELIYHHSEISLLAYYEKNFINQYTDLAPHGKYSKTYRSLFLRSGEKCVPVKRKRHFLNYFARSDKNKIRRFMRRNHIKYSKATSSELRQLMKYCSQLHPK